LSVDGFVLDRFEKASLSWFHGLIAKGARGNRIFLKKNEICPLETCFPLIFNRLQDICNKIYS
jgi:hypothetical protein